MSKENSERMLTIRKLLGISQKDMAERLGLSRQHLCRLEKGETPAQERHVIMIEGLALRMASEKGSFESLDLRMQESIIRLASLQGGPEIALEGVNT